MAILECLLVMITSLSVATAATSKEHKAVEQVTGSLPWEQPFHYMEDSDRHLTPQSHELESVNHGTGKGAYQTTYTQPQSKKFDQMLDSLYWSMQKCSESLNDGIAKGTLKTTFIQGSPKHTKVPNAKEVIKQRANRQVDKEVEELKDLHKNIGDESCTVPGMCTSTGRWACCWIPGDEKGTKHRVN